MNPYRADIRPLRQLDPRRMTPTQRVFLCWTILGACYGVAFMSWMGWLR